MLPRDRYVASDIHPDYLHYLRNLSSGKPYLEVARVDLESSADLEALGDRFDTVLCLNVLEHVADPAAALRNIHAALAPGGRLVLYVPQKQSRYCSLDRALEHRCRYERAGLEAELTEAGFRIESCRGFNRSGVPGWLWNGKLLRRTRFSRWQLKIFDVLVPLLRRIDRVFPWPGLGLIAVARRPA